MPVSLRVALALGVLATLALAPPASAGHTNDPRSRNVVPLGHLAWDARVSPDGNFANDTTLSDIAFWGNYVIEGSYSGFRFVDVSDPNNPRTVSDTPCGGQPPTQPNTNGQGDITISPDGNILVRSQDSGRILPGNDQSLACTPGTGGSTAQGWEGLQIFDTSNKAAPQFVKAVFTDFGSHTHTQYHDKANNRLIIYVSRSGTRAPSTGGYGLTPTNPYGGQNWPAEHGCITAVEVPIAAPQNAQVVNRCIPAGTAPPSVTAGGCHDVFVYEGLKLLYGACRPNMILWDISDPVNPRQLHDQQYPGINGWHSAAISWDGKVLFAGWEPGGGTAPRCQATGAPLGGTTGNVQTDAMKSIFAFRATDGALVGQWVLPQEQSDQENCTIHNFNVVPHPHKHIVVGGHYQAGMTVTDFTDPQNPRQVAFSDPPCFDANPTLGGCQAAAPGFGDVDPGAWSTHWYNGLIYESDILEGLNIWDIAEPWWENTLTLPFLNPQTATERMDCTIRATGRLRQNRRSALRIAVRVNGQALDAMRVTLRGAGVSRTVTANADGNASVMLRPRRKGTLRLRSSSLNVFPCATAKRVAAAPRARPRPPRPAPELTGRPR
jgi:LVIVD repeat